MDTRAECCNGCGAEKDPAALELYPWPDEDGVTVGLISPLFHVEVAGGSGCRVAAVCHSCFHRLSPDMWISRAGWDAIRPVTPYEGLPEE